MDGVGYFYNELTIFSKIMRYQKLSLPVLNEPLLRNDLPVESIDRQELRPVNFFSFSLFFFSFDEARANVEIVITGVTLHDWVKKGRFSHLFPSIFLFLPAQRKGNKVRERYHSSKRRVKL